jgi:hypothetical protein
MNRELGTEKALIEAYDQATTAVAAYHAGVSFPALSLTKPREDGSRFRDGVIQGVENWSSKTEDDFRAKIAIFAAGIGERTVRRAKQVLEHGAPELIAAADRGIDCDPASCADANEVVGATVYYCKEDDGLKQAWRGRVWLNPPYATELIRPFANLLV